jgi:homoserine dehydrogenase
MEKTGRSFADVLREAQALGYAEADPTMDVGGFDAGHKISILAALAFGCAPDFEAAEIEGISEVELLDIKLAKDLGYRIKLVAGAAKTDDGVSVKVHPSLVPLEHPLAQAGGALNALFIEGKRIGRIFIQGPGAGAGPTAAAVAADIADVMTGAKRPVFQAPAGQLKPFVAVDPARSVGKAYLRIMVRDEPGRHRRHLRDPGRMRRLDRQLPAEARRRRGRRADRARHPRDSRIQSPRRD